MVHAEAIQGNWNRVRGQIEKRWGEVRGDELDQFRGDVDALVGEIQRRTGEARGTIEDYLEHLAAGGASAVGRAGEAAKQYASRAAGAVAAAPRRVAEGARAGYSSTEEMVRDRPVQRVTTAFLAGLFTGVAIGLLMRSR